MRHCRCFSSLFDGYWTEAECGGGGERTKNSSGAKVHTWCVRIMHVLWLFKSESCSVSKVNQIHTHHSQLGLALHRRYITQYFWSICRCFRVFTDEPKKIVITSTPQARVKTLPPGAVKTTTVNATIAGPITTTNKVFHLEKQRKDGTAVHLQRKILSGEISKWVVD